MNRVRGIPADQETAAPVAGRESLDAMAQGYRQMAADREQELEAEEWVEGLIHDAE